MDILLSCHLFWCACVGNCCAKAGMFCCTQMQMRFDGYIGFPGGFLDSTDETVVDGLNRELVEEINFDVDKHKVTQDNYFMSCVCSHKKLVTHFYVIEVTVSQYADIERRTLAAHDWGGEVRLFLTVSFSQLYFDTVTIMYFIISVLVYICLNILLYSFADAV